MINELVLAHPGRATRCCRQARARPWPTAQRETRAPCLGLALLLAGGGWIGIGSLLLLVV